MLDERQEVLARALKFGCANTTCFESRCADGTLWNWYMLSSRVNDWKLRWRKNLGQSSDAKRAGSKMTTWRPSCDQPAISASHTRSSV